MTDLSRLRIDRDAPPRRRWLLWGVLLILAGIAAAIAVPRASRAIEKARAPEVSVEPARRLAGASPGQSADVPVLVASGYVVARRSTDVGVKAAGRLAWIGVEEGSRVRSNQVIARLEHADLDAALDAARASVAEAEAALGQGIAAADEDRRELERQRALRRDLIATEAALTAADAAAAVSAARVRALEAAVQSARARVRVAEESIENTNVRSPFGGVVIRKRAEVGETVSPMGVAGQATREAGAIATVADLDELEVQAEVSESNIARIGDAMPAAVQLPAVPGASYRGRVRQVFPAADRAKAIVEVRVSILDPDGRVKPEMTANVTFLEPRPAGSGATGPAGDVTTVPKRAIVERDGARWAWVVAESRVRMRAVRLGAERLDQVEVVSGVMPGEAVVVGPPGVLRDGALVRVR